ncbi:MAG: LamG domain-containing protein [Lentisphaeria bacterium]|nr:LamG domain-containing protein [Lentisphaeria bacterium]
MKKSFMAVAASMASAVLLTAAEPVYYISFDKTLQANYGGTGSASVTTGDSNQEAVGMKGVLSQKSGKVTADKLLVPGLAGNAFASGRDKSGNTHSVFYKPVPAMNGKECTISFWIKPENWFGNDKNQHVFVSASGPGSQRLLIYRIPYQSRLAVYLGPLSNSKAATVIFTRVPSWKPGQWHQITVSWNERAVQLHLDGVSKAMAALKTPLEGDFYTLAIGEHFGGSDPGQTLVDEVRIFDKKLTEAELTGEFQRLAPKLPAAGNGLHR